MKGHSHSGQLTLPLIGSHGGRRPGAGRKRIAAHKRTTVAHRSRTDFKPRFPLHITIKARDGLPSFRRPRLASRIMDSLERNARKPGFRVCEYTVQRNHVHLIVEADSADQLARGMNGLQVSLVRTINGHLGRKGQVFPESYHHRVLPTPREVKINLEYVLHNHHGHNEPIDGPDPCSSGWQFRGWDRRPTNLQPRTLPEPRTWLLTVGWRKYHGPVPMFDIPAYRGRRVVGRYLA